MTIADGKGLNGNKCMNEQVDFYYTITSLKATYKDKLMSCHK